MSDEIAYKLEAVVTEELHPLLIELLIERRRSLITELRKIEEILGMPASIPPRRRPH